MTTDNHTDQPGISPREKRIKRLHYQSWHRGCKETDVLLGYYCREHLDDATEAELDLFESLLQEDDAEIWRWVAYNETPNDAAYQPIIEAMKRFHQQSTPSAS